MHKVCETSAPRNNRLGVLYANRKIWRNISNARVLGVYLPKLQWAQDFRTKNLVLNLHRPQIGISVSIQCVLPYPSRVSRPSRELYETSEYICISSTLPHKFWFLIELSQRIIIFFNTDTARSAILRIAKLKPRFWAVKMRILAGDRLFAPNDVSVRHKYRARARVSMR